MKKKNTSLTEKILNVYVQPRASRNEILGYRNEFLRIRVVAAPTDGEANRLCREILAKALGTSPSGVEMLSGHKARRKRLRVSGVDAVLWQKLEKERKGGL
ncbi:MAG: DUF167 domain-containing protein [Pseudomonadota bacterium]